MSKVVIPKFIAHEIEKKRTDISRGYEHWLVYHVMNLSNEVEDWLDNKENFLKLVQAVLEGYEIEKELVGFLEAFQQMKNGANYVCVEDGIPYSFSNQLLMYWNTVTGWEEAYFHDYFLNSKWHKA